MDSTDVVLLAGAAALIGLTWILTATETALGRLSGARVEEIAKQSPRRADRLRPLVADPARYVNSAMLLSTTTGLAAFAIVALVGLRLRDWQGGGELLVLAVVVGLVYYTFLGVSARTIGAQRPDATAAITSRAVRALSVLVHPIAALLIRVGNAVTPGRGYRTGPFASQAELRELVDQAEEAKVIEDDERQMIHSVFALGGTIARELMVPRTEMVHVHRDKAIGQAMSLALRSGYSRIPVVGDGADDVLGVAFLKDLTRLVFEVGGSQPDESVGDHMRPVRFVPDTKPADDLLKEMQAAQEHMAILVDEFGGTAGLVTIEDILEEIVGEIADEYDTAAPEVEPMPDGTLRLSSRMSVEHLMHVTGITLDPDAEGVETALGLLARRLDLVPIPGASIVEQGWEFTALAGGGRRNRIETLLARRLPAVEEGEDD